MNNGHRNQNTSTGYQWPVGLWFTLSGEAERWQREVQVPLGLETSRLFNIWYLELSLNFLAMSWLDPIAPPQRSRRNATFHRMRGGLLHFPPKLRCLEPRLFLAVSLTCSIKRGSSRSVEFLPWSTVSQCVQLSCSSSKLLQRMLREQDACPCQLFSLPVPANTKGHVNIRT